MEFRFGIEHEVAFLEDGGKFADFTRTSFKDFQQIVDKLPLHPADYPQLRLGDAGIKHKRWYVEGFERFDGDGKLVDCVPKGIEVRTTIHRSIQGAIGELTESFELLRRSAFRFGFTPVLLSFNPYHAVFEPDPPLNDYELSRRDASPEKRTAHIPMLTFGPDLNLSVEGLSTEQVIEVGKKLTFYSPFLVPFSYSSPFLEGRLWNGLSVRTFYRTGARPAAMVFIDEPDKLIESTPSLTKPARIAAEAGRIEFKAFDSCADFSVYGGLLSLLKGLVLDQSLRGSAVVPDATLHRVSAREGFENRSIVLTAQRLLRVAEEALEGDPDGRWLESLEGLLKSKQSPAHRLVAKFEQTGSIERTLEGTYGIAAPPSSTPSRHPRRARDSSSESKVTSSAPSARASQR